MRDIKQLYKKYCEDNHLYYSVNEDIISKDDTTLFTTAGMQPIKHLFLDPDYKGTLATTQTCIRLNDLENVGDGTHLLIFFMLGLFSFREMTIKQAIDFWYNFITKILKLKLSKVTIHPDRKEWRKYYAKSIKVEEDNECIWSHGNIKGYSTEFYVNDIEIGNIVNPFGDCIDVGFGFDRLYQLVNKTEPYTRAEAIRLAIKTIENSGVEPSNVKHGYILRKLLRIAFKENIQSDSKYFKDEIERQEKLEDRYLKLKDKFPNKTREWWFETHGIEL